MDDTLIRWECGTMTHRLCLIIHDSYTMTHRL